LNWWELAELLSLGHEKAYNKKEARLFSPWTPRKGVTRRKTAAFSYAATLVIDMDKIDGFGIEDLKRCCSPYAAVFHTTHSHGVGGHGCFRIYMPLSKPVNASQYPIVHARLMAALPELAGRVDSTCSQPTRCFFMPSCPPERQHLAKTLVSSGIPVDVESLLASPVEAYEPTFDPAAPRPSDRAMHSPAAALAGAGFILPDVVPDGAGRESGMLAYAGYLRGKGVDQALIEGILLDRNQLHNVPPRSEEVVLDRARRYATTDTHAPTPSDWPALTPLPPKYLNPPKLDTSILPAALAEYVNDAAARMQVPPEMIATPLVISLGSVLGKLLAVQPMQRNNDWTEYPNLWGVGILPPAMLKSPAMAAGALFIQKLEETAQSAHALAMAVWESDDRVRKLEIDNLQGQAKGLVKSGDRAGARRLLDSVQAIKPPIRKRYVLQDTTPEARLDILTDNPNGCMLVQDELDGHMAQLRRDGYETSRAQELQFYDGKQDYASDRIKRGSSIAEAPRMAMYGNLQPAKVEKYLRDLKQGGNDDGYVQRLFQLGIQPTIDAAYVLTDRKPDKLAEARVKQLFDAAASMVPVRDILHGRLQPKVLQFTADAQEVFNTFLTELEGTLRAGKLSPTQAGHVGKYRGTLPKLALLMAYAEDPHATCIDVLALDRAQRLLAFYQSHARRIYAVDTRGAVVSAHELLARIRKGSVPDGFNPRDDVLRREWDGLAKSAELEEALALLVKHGYLKDTETPTAGRARRAIWIHPDYPTKGDIRPTPADKAN
jgi:putative DNA primase/helicase